MRYLQYTAVLPKIPHCNCSKSVPNRPLWGRSGRFGTLLQQLECGIFGRTAVNPKEHANEPSTARQHKKTQQASKATKRKQVRTATQRKQARTATQRVQAHRAQPWMTGTCAAGKTTELPGLGSSVKGRAAAAPTGAGRCRPLSHVPLRQNTSCTSGTPGILSHRSRRPQGACRAFSSPCPWHTTRCGRHWCSRTGTGAGPNRTW